MNLFSWLFFLCTFDEDWIQGVSPRITVDQVKKVTRFIAK